MSNLGAQGNALLVQFEGPSATKAYLCSGGRYTLGRGATEWPNGDPVKANDICTPEQADALTDWSLNKFAKVVDESKPERVILTEHERAALILLAYNIGQDAYRMSSVLTRLRDNPNDREFAAAAFALWCKATNDRPEKYDLDEPHYQAIMAKNANGQWRWVGPALPVPKDFIPIREGDEFWGVHKDDPTQRVPLGMKFCKYQRALPGLLRRHLSEACLFLSLDWRQTCRKEVVSIVSTRVWDNNDKCWEDLVRKKTELADILPSARQYPLAASAAVEARSYVTDILEASTPNTVPLEVESLQLPEDELLLESVASPSGGSTVVTDSAPAKTDVASGLAPESKAPASVAPASHVNETAKSQHEAGVVSKKPEIVTTSAPGPAPPKPPPIIAPKSIDPRTPDYGGVDIEKGPKNMTDSRRFVGMLIVGLGSLVQVLAARDIFSSVAGAIFFDLSRDPVILALMAGAVVWVFGHFTKKKGGKVMTTGFIEAEQLLK